MKIIQRLISQGVTARQIRRGTVPKRFRRTKTSKEECKRAQIFMLALNVKQATVFLDFSRKWLEKVSGNYLMYNGIKDNVSGFFTPAPADPTLILWKAAIDGFKDGQDKVAAKEVDAVKSRNLKWKALMKLNRKIRSYVQGIVDDKPEEAILICAEAHMKLVVPEGRDKNTFTAVSKSSGSVELQGVVKAHRQCIEWEVSTDPTNAALWNVLRIPPTVAADTVVTGLISDKDYYFRHRVCDKYGPGEWSEVLKVRVK